MCAGFQRLAEIFPSLVFRVLCSCKLEFLFYLNIQSLSLLLFSQNLTWAGGVPQAMEAEAASVPFEMAVPVPALTTSVAGLSSPEGVVKTVRKRKFIF